MVFNIQKQKWKDSSQDRRSSWSVENSQYLQVEVEQVQHEEDVSTDQKLEM